jgi:hypothetical protein
LSKGSNRRQEDVKKVRDNWDVIFGKKDPKEEKPKGTTEKQKTK